MTSASLPTKLGKEPLLEAIFEMQFVANMPASTVLPGILFAETADKTKIRMETTSAVQIPGDSTSNVRGVQLVNSVRVVGNGYAVSVADAAVSIACQLPYPGWKNFKRRILEVAETAVKTGIIQSISRISLKYTDMVESETLPEKLGGLNVNLRVGDFELKTENATIRVEIPGDPLIHIVQLVSDATVGLQSGGSKRGTAIDVDSVYPLSDMDAQTFVTKLDPLSEALHTENKRVFFSCIGKDVLNRLEPVYVQQ